MPRDGSDGWLLESAEPDGTQILTSTLAEPAIFYDAGAFVQGSGDTIHDSGVPTSENEQANQAAIGAGEASAAGQLPTDLYASFQPKGEDHGASETLAELAAAGAPPSAVSGAAWDTGITAEPGASDLAGDDLWASLTEAAEPGASAAGLHALQSLLLGQTSDYDERLALIEKRLEQLALYVTGEVQSARAEGARVADLRDRLDAVAARAEAALDFARGGDVAVHSLDTLQRQVDALRAGHAESSQAVEQRLSAIEDRTRQRQRAAHAARRAELMRLRMRVYAPPETVGSSRLRALQRRADERALTSTGAGALGGSALAAVRHGHDAGAAWHVFSHGVVVFFGTLLTLLVVLARVTGDRVRDAWDHLIALFARD